LDWLYKFLCKCKKVIAKSPCHSCLWWNVKIQNSQLCPTRVWLAPKFIRLKSGAVFHPDFFVDEVDIAENNPGNFD
jgi:hypothetical protein